MEAVYADTRVVKRLRASQHGAIKWARRYGDSLVCVRYRHDAQGGYRYTTIELVVDEAPITSRARPDDIVMIQIDLDEANLQKLARSHGARWEPKLRAWAMPRKVAEKLRLLSRTLKPRP